MFRRGEVFWCQDNKTGKQETLRTKDRQIAERLLHARNEAHQQPIINLQIARAYLQASDPAAATRTWQVVMDEMTKLKRGNFKVGGGRRMDWSGCGKTRVVWQSPSR
jgi:hypothetical protein